MTKQFPISRKGFYLVLKQNETYYDFVRIWQDDDESLYLSFIGVKRSPNHWSGILQACYSDNDELIPCVIERECCNEDSNEHRISFHTSGLVKYHGFDSGDQAFEPLFDVKSINNFFLMCISEIRYLTGVSENWKGRESQAIIDLTVFEDKAVDFLFSIVPRDYQCAKTAENSFVLNYGLFGLLIEIAEDSKCLELEKLVEHFKVLSAIPHRLENMHKQEHSCDEAFLKYEQALYKTDEILIVPRGENGWIDIIFSVEMRKAPWIKIEFAEQGFRVLPKNVKRGKFGKVKISFRVSDKSGKIVCDTSRIQIKNLELDAEIYDDESVAPEGFI